MIVECRARVRRDGRIENLEPEKLVRFRKAHKEDDELILIFDDAAETDYQRRSRLFHALCGRYAAALGYSQQDAKIEIKYRHGPSIVYGEEFKPPRWRGMFVELPEGYGERLVFLESITAYTAAQWVNLIEGAIHDCLEAQVDITDIMAGLEERDRRRNNDEATGND